MTCKFTLLMVVLLGAAFGVSGQSVQVNRNNRTIQVSLTETLRVEPEIAEITFGYRNFAATKDAAYQENVQKSNAILKALADAGVSKEALETETLVLNRPEEYETPNIPRKDREFEAKQEWILRISVGEAQKLIDLAVAAGANLVEDVTWTVADLGALDAKVDANALSKARLQAEKMAKPFNVKVGDLLYLSNQEAMPPADRFVAAGVMAKLAAPPPPPTPPLKLLPAKVERSATITAIFAVE